MKVAIFISIFTLFMSSSSICYSYDTIFRKARAPIVIDGDLTDWEEIVNDSVDIKSINKKIYDGFKLEIPQDNSDLSASFRCFADQFYFYVGIVVLDDDLVVDTSKLGQPYLDDTAEIIFYNDLPNSLINKIWISAKKDWTTRLEGRSNNDQRNTPYIKKLGITAVFMKVNSGYQIEVGIPLNALGINEIINGDSFVLNIRIYDNDNGKLESVLELGDVIDATSMTSLNTNIADNKIIFNNLDITDQQIENQYNLELYMAEAFSNEGDYIESDKILHEIIKTSNKENDKIKAKVLLLRNYYLCKKFEQAKQLYNEIIKERIDDSKLKLEAQMIYLSMIEDPYTHFINLHIGKIK
ncbi:MAG: hypothetical protein JXB48_02690 [Candidatus Latescibacteria bacterium]|nr:hypothetical protein [Candidatus Latescibacterota bacterium]